MSLDAALGPEDSAEILNALPELISEDPPALLCTSPITRGVPCLLPYPYPHSHRLSSSESVVARLKNGHRGFTLFSPSRHAFDAFTDQYGAAVLEPDFKPVLDALVADLIMTRPLVSSSVPAHGLHMQAASGRRVHVTPSAGGGLTVDGIPTEAVDARAGPGVVHVLQEMLITGAMRERVRAQLQLTDDSEGEGEVMRGEQMDTREKVVTDTYVAPMDPHVITQPPPGAHGHKHGGGPAGGATDPADAGADGVATPRRRHHHRDRDHEHLNGMADPKLVLDYVRMQRDCSGHGRVENGTECVCAVLYAGPQCERVRKVHALPSLHTYGADLILNQKHLAAMDDIKVPPTPALAPPTPPRRAPTGSLPTHRRVRSPRRWSPRSRRCPCSTA